MRMNSARIEGGRGGIHLHSVQLTLQRPPSNLPDPLIYDKQIGTLVTLYLSASPVNYFSNLSTVYKRDQGG